MALAPVTPRPPAASSLVHLFDKPSVHPSMTHKSSAALRPSATHSALPPSLTRCAQSDDRLNELATIRRHRDRHAHHDHPKHVHFHPISPPKNSNHLNDPSLRRRLSDNRDASSLSTNLPSAHSFSSVPSTPPSSPTPIMSQVLEDTSRDRTRFRPRDYSTPARERSLLAKRHRADVAASTTSSPHASDAETLPPSDSHSTLVLPFDHHAADASGPPMRSHHCDRIPSHRAPPNRLHSVSNKSAEVPRSPRSSHVRAHTIDNGAGVHRHPLNMSDFRLGNVLGSGGTATVIRAEFLAKPGRPDLRGWVSSAAAVCKNRYEHGRAHGHRRQPSSPVIRSGAMAEMSQPTRPVGHAMATPNRRPLPIMPPCPREVALKVVQKKSLSRRGRHYLTREIAVHRALHDHDNVVPLLDVFEDGSSIYLVQELMRGGDLYSAMKRERGGISEGIALAITSQILEALTYMHERGFAHRDIKPENVMFGERPNLKNGNVGPVKLIDFGLACARDPRASVSERMSSEKCGTIRYAAPEIVMDSCYVPEMADVWSVGVVLYSVIAHCNPFTGKSEREVLERIESGGPCFEAREWQNVSEATKNLIRWMLQRKALERPTAQVALNEIQRIVRERCGRVRNGQTGCDSAPDCNRGGQDDSAEADKDMSGFASAVTPEKRREDRVEEGRPGPNLFDGIRAFFGGVA